MPSGSVARAERIEGPPFTAPQLVRMETLLKPFLREKPDVEDHQLGAPLIVWVGEATHEELIALAQHIERCSFTALLRERLARAVRARFESLSTEAKNAEEIILDSLRPFGGDQGEINFDPD